MDTKHMEEVTNETASADLGVKDTTVLRQGINIADVPPGSSLQYEKKIAILNSALIDLGMGGFQWKVFMTTGFGWFVDNVSASILRSLHHATRYTNT